MSTDHLRPFLDSKVDTVQQSVPDEIVDVVRLGRMTALCKPNGGVRGIVAARTISQ